MARFLEQIPDYGADGAELFRIIAEEQTGELVMPVPDRGWLPLSVVYLQEAVPASQDEPSSQAGVFTPHPSQQHLELL